MATELERGLALLKSLAAPHHLGDEHAWRQCRACLASEKLSRFGTTGLSPAQRELQAVIADYERLKAIAAGVPLCAARGDGRHD